MGLLMKAQKVKGHLSFGGFRNLGLKEYLWWRCDTCGDIFPAVETEISVYDHRKSHPASNIEAGDFEELQPSCNGQKITKCPWCG
jgi:hypothetical protein